MKEDVGLKREGRRRMLQEERSESVDLNFPQDPGELLKSTYEIGGHGCSRKEGHNRERRLTLVESAAKLGLALQPNRGRLGCRNDRRDCAVTRKSTLSVSPNLAAWGSHDTGRKRGGRRRKISFPLARAFPPFLPSS